MTIYPGVAQLGSEATAAGGGYREPSEWQWSADDEAAQSARKMPDTTTGRALDLGAERPDLPR